MSDRLTITSIAALSLALIITFIVLCSCSGKLKATNQDLQYANLENAEYSRELKAQRGRIAELEERIEFINRGE